MYLCVQSKNHKQMQTKVAVSSQNKRTITGHAGKCYHFYLYTIAADGTYTKESLELEKGNSLHDVLHGSTQDHPIYKADMLLTQSIGAGAVQKLALKQVAAHNILESDPDTAIQKLIEGTLQAVAPAEHQHNHEHHHHGGGGCKNCGGH